MQVVDSFEKIPENETLLISKYIHNPLQYQETKFDLRIHFLITSVDPLILYLHEGVNVKFASEKYSTKIFGKFHHLTNVKINAQNPNFVHREWGLNEIRNHFEDNNWDWNSVWRKIEDLLIKTIIANVGMFRERLNRFSKNRYMFFQFFGLDVLVDDNLEPWFLEINNSPGICSKMPKVDRYYQDLLAEAFNIARFHLPLKLTKSEEKKILFELAMQDEVERLTHDPKLYSLKLTKQEKKKHDIFENMMKTNETDSLLEDKIIQDLTPNDVRLLIRSEDELQQAVNFKRIFPTSKSHKYLKYFNKLSYNDLLLHSWEQKYGKNREPGIKKLQKYCKERLHLRTEE